MARSELPAAGCVGLVSERLLAQEAALSERKLASAGFYPTTSKSVTHIGSNARRIQYMQARMFGRFIIAN